jgi:hypothetical protein
MMNQEIKREWIEALRSGKYKQARGFLRYRGGYCCLGVLMDIQGAKDDAFNDGDVPTARFSAGLPISAKLVLAAANDGTECAENGQIMRPHTFNEIANYLEREKGI